MALKSSREGLRKELVDYLGNLIVDDNLRNEIVKAVGDKFVTPEVLNENVNNLTMQITTENGERIEADNTLQNNITAEATARESADTTLQENINAETSAREGADTTLQNNINAETTARQEAVTNLEKLIGTGGNFYGINTGRVLSTTVPYTATEDCMAFVSIQEHYGNGSYLVDDVDVVSYDTAASTKAGGGTIPLKKGQTLKRSGATGFVRVFGLKG